MAASNQEWKACKDKYHEAERRLFALVGLALNEVDSFSGFISPFTVDCLFRFWEAGHTRWHLHLRTWQTAISNNAHDTRTKIGAKNPYQKIGTENWHENRALSYLLRKTGAGKIQYQTARQMCQKPVPVVYWYRLSCANFWHMCHGHNYREQLDKLWTLKIDSNSLNNSISDRCQKHDRL